MATEYSAGNIGSRRWSTQLTRRQTIKLGGGLAMATIAGSILTAAEAAGRTEPQPRFPIRAAFYYPWFPEAWNQQGYNPFTYYHPSLGFYESSDPSVIRKHIASMRYGHIEAGISSWWGQGSKEDLRFPLLLQGARRTNFKWAVYYETEGYSNPTVEQIRNDLAYIGKRYGNDPNYLRIDGRFVVFVYNADDTDCGVADRWKQANTVGAYIVLKVFGGYRDCPSQPDGWHQYGPAVAEDSQAPYSFTISPGFWKRGEPYPRLYRDPVRWEQNIRDMVASRARFQMITTFNEWGEGTAVESAHEWSTPSGYGTYLDALHRINGK